MIRTFFPGDTVMLTLTSSAPPDSAPLLSVLDASNTVIVSATSITSDSTHYYGLFTQTNTPGYYKAVWRIQKTLVASAYQFIRKSVFQIKPVATPP